MQIQNCTVLCGHAREERICQTTGECVPSECNKVTASSIDSNCGQGQVYCADHDACIPACPGKSASMTRDAALRCEGELTYCMSTRTCLPHLQCEETGRTECPKGTTFCISTGRCQSTLCGPVTGQASCPLGYVFCVDAGGCQKSCHAVSGEPSRFSSLLNPLLKCPPQMIFCALSGSCVESGMCGQNLHEENMPKICVEGKIFCVSTGMCTKESLCKPPLQLSEGRNDQSSTIHRCRRGMIFCIATQSCTWEDRCHNYEANSQETGQKCSGREIFCVSHGRCMREEACRGGSNSVQSSSDREIQICTDGQVYCNTLRSCILSHLCISDTFTVSALVKGRFCETNKVFCLSSGTCEERGKCGTRPEHTWGTMCPRGYIYCIEKQECIQADKGCGLTGSALKCEPGTVFCASKGQCSAECESEVLLWRPELQCPVIMGEFTFSNCITSTHCPYNHICCPDADSLHLQCVGSNNTSAEHILKNVSCPIITASNEDTESGPTCTIPQDCPQSSLCCEGKCRTPRGSKSCPPFTLYCPVTKKCEKLGNECAAVCMPGHVFCTYERKCRKPDQCEFDSVSGAPWTLPGPLILGNGSSLQPKEKRLNYLFRNESSELADTTLTIQGTYTNSGVFQKKKGTSDQWEDLKAGDTFSTSDFVRFVPPSNDFYSFGVAFLNVTEASGMNFSRYIVQLYAPKPPDIELSLRVPELNTIEDEVQMTTFNELFSLGNSDWVYWNEWQSALGLPLQIASMGLLDFTHPAAISWVRALTSPDFENKNADGGCKSPSSAFSSEGISRGIRIGYKNIHPLDEEPLISLDISEDGGKSWIPVSPAQPCEIFVSKYRSIGDTVIRMTPAPNANGNITFLFTPVFYYGSFDQNSQIEQETNSQTLVLNVPVLPMNDAPVAKTNADLSQIPAIMQGTSEMQISAKALASICFHDPDEDQMGIAIQYAQSSNLGYWSYSNDGGSTWREITDLAKNPYPSGLSMTAGYQGIINTQEQNPLRSARIRAALAAPVIRNARITTNMKLTDHTKGPESPAPHDQAIFTERSDGRFEVSGNYQATVSALVLPPSVLIKFKATQATQPWTVVAAMDNTRLTFSAWDTTDMDIKPLTVMRLNITLPFCSQCGGSGSLSAVPATIVAEWRGCDGARVIDGTIKVKDRCGVCGGDDQSCVDCNNVVNGTAHLDCGNCIGGTTGVFNVRDCAGQCGNENIEKQYPQGLRCILKSELATALCDGTVDSGAHPNECGVCVEGTTNKDVNEGKDSCGDCSGKNECVGCDGVPFSSKVLDICGQCLEENDKNLKKGCKTIGELETSFIDAAVTMALPMVVSASVTDLMRSQLILRATVIGLSETNYKLESCSFVQSAEKSVQSPASVISQGVLKVEIPVLSAGKWIVACSLKGETGETETVRSSETLNVVDSSSVEIESISKNRIALQQDSELTVTLKKAVDLVEAYCLLIYDTIGDEKHFVKLDIIESQDNRIVKCTVDPTLRPGQAKLAVLLSLPMSHVVRRRSPVLSLVPVEITAAAPKALSATLSPYCSDLRITFDTNIESSTECMNSFQNKSLFGKDASCEIMSSDLIIHLGKESSISGGQMINFAQLNGITQKYAEYSSTSPKVSGSIVLRQSVQATMHFSVVGDTTVCKGSNVRLEAILDQVPNKQDYMVDWNVTYERKQNVNYEQRDVLRIWNSTREIQTAIDNSFNDKAVEFPEYLLLPNVQYVIIALLKGPNENRIAPASIRVSAKPPRQNFFVRLKGPTNIYVDKVYSYMADVTHCQPQANLTENRITYFWTFSNDAVLLDKNFVGSTITIPRGTLKAGKNYTLTVLAIAETTESALGNLTIQTMPQDVTAVVGAVRLQTTSSSKFVLDASMSTNPSGFPQDLTFRWSCALANGGTCQLAKDARRFENSMKDSDLTAAVVIVPPVLPPNKYIFTCEVSNKKSTNSSNTEVELMACKAPVLYVNPPPSYADVTEPITIQGFITSPPGVFAEWKFVEDPGFEYVDLFDFSSGFTGQIIKEPSVNRPFTVIIPPRSAKWSGLTEGARYKLRLSASLSECAASEVDVVIETKKSPVPGTFTVSPTSGEALLTNFTFEALGWTDSPLDLPLKAAFGYIVVDSGAVVWKEMVIGSNLSATMTLTANSETTKIIPVLMICDSSEACTSVNGTQITVTLPNSLPESTLAKISNSLGTKINEDAKLYGALAESLEVMLTLEAMGAAGQMIALRNVIEYDVALKTNSLNERLASIQNKAEAIKAANDMIAGLLNILNAGTFYIGGMFKSLVSLLPNLLSASINAPPPVQDPATTQSAKQIRSTRSDVIYYPETNEDLQRVRTFARKEDKNKQNLEKDNIKDSERPSSGNSHRVKRESADSSPTYAPFNLKQVKNYLTIAEAEIQNAETQSNKSAAMDKLVKTLPIYMAGLCLSMTSGSSPAQVNGNLVAIRVVKSQLLNGEEDKAFPITDANATNHDFIEMTSTVTWGPVLTQYKEWDCTSAVDGNERKRCYGACLVTVEFDNLFASPYVRASIPGQQKGHLIKTALLNPSQGTEIQPTASSSSSSSSYLSFSLPLKNMTTQTGFKLKCFGWVAEQWDADFCNNGFKRATSTNRLFCSCRNTGYINVFAVPYDATRENGTSTTPPPTNVLTTARPISNVRNITMKLDGDFNKSVKGREAEFKAEFRNQLALKFNVPLINIKILSVRQGSIVVDVQLVDNATQRTGSSESIDNVYQYLMEAIKSGDLVFAGLDQERLRVISPDERTAAQNPTYLPILIGGIVGGVLLIGTVLVVLAIYFNKKKRMDKVSPINGSLQPTYRAIHFEKSLDGTSSFTKKNNSGKNGYGDWQPELAAYTGDGLYIERNSTGKDSRTDSGIGDDNVPDAFNYRPPTKAQLENSGPIPEHILRRIKQESIPGTPDNLL